jgi:Amt family ammonium transporter
MVATGAGLLWLGWNGFNGGDPYYAGVNASLAVLNTNLAAAIAFLSWIALDYATGHKPSLISSVNGMITGLVVITPCAGFVNGWGALAIGLIGGSLCYFALNYLSRMRPFRNVDDTLGVIYTHGFAGLFGGLLLGFFADPHILVYAATGGGATDLPGFSSVFNGGSFELLKDEAETALWVITFSAAGTFILLKLIGLFVSLRMEEAEMEEGDIAVHGHEVYPSDVPSLAFPAGAERT